MLGKRVWRDERTSQAPDLLARDSLKTFQGLADETFGGLHKETSGLCTVDREAPEMLSRPTRWVRDGRALTAPTVHTVKNLRKCSIIRSGAFSIR